MKSLTVVTPWHGCPELAPAFWQAMSALRPDDRVIVIDNGSTPSIVAPADPRFHVERVATNEGFSPACNRGLALAVTEVVAFVNNDIRATSRTWADDLRAAVAPGVLAGAHLRGDAHTAVDGVTVPYLDGWCLAGMREDLQTLGGWDDLEEPSYFGDNLLCARAVAAGMELVQVDVGLTHLGNYTSRRYLPRDEVSARNRQRYETVVRELRKPASSPSASTVALITASLPTRSSLLSELLGTVAKQDRRPDWHLIGVDYAREGAAAVRNRLATAAPEADWLAFVDDDDVLYPNHLDLLVAAGDKTGADLVYPYCDVTGRSDGWNPSRPFDADALRQGNYVPITVLIRRSVFASLGGFRPYEEWSPALQAFDGGGFRGHEDWDLWLRMLYAGCRFECVPERTWQYRLHAGSKTVVGELAAA